MNEPEANPEDQAQDALLRPPISFEGKELWPLTPESDLIMAHVSRGNDLARFTAMAFVYIHTKRGGKAFFDDLQVVMPIAWDDPTKFRIEVLRFFSKMPDEARQAAVRAWMSAYDLVRKTEVVAADPVGSRRRAKKKPETTRRRSSGGATHSRRR